MSSYFLLELVAVVFVLVGVCGGHDSAVRFHIALLRGGGISGLHRDAVGLRVHVSGVRYGLNGRAGILRLDCRLNRGRQFCKIDRCAFHKVRN